MHPHQRLALLLLACTPCLAASCLSAAPSTTPQAPARSPSVAGSSTQEEGSLEWYLPEGTAYQADFPRPESVLGWSVGSWHVRHDQLVEWYRTVAKRSPRFQLETYGRTHEQRPLLLATISSPENLERIEEIRRAHVESVLAGEEQPEGPTVVWMGYSVHGNESSGSNAALLLAYHLAAATGPDIEEFLEDTVVLIDPCINPDGLSRFAHWANTHRGQELVGDPAHREHREGWPSGRTNHYWFDLNRDWLLLTHPESRARLEAFHRWMPNVLTDYHEMGTDSTYFFQPGIPSRQNPITPLQNLDLTRAIAGYHAKALDRLGSLYYTEESFDDFYYGKGSTYPDVNGCIGILFEQASSRGHLQENSYGGISFPFTIRNQLVTSLSTLEAAHSLGEELRTYQRGFYRTAREAAAEHPVRGWIFGAPEDPERARLLAELLARHRIQVHGLARAHTGANGQTYEPGSAWVVPADQSQFRLVRAVFETRTSWPDNTFYDVSSWTLPLCFGLPFEALDGELFTEELLGSELAESRPAGGALGESEAVTAWLFEWHDRRAPRALQELLSAGVRARVATRRFTCETRGGQRAFDLGTIVVPTGIQQLEPSELVALLEDTARSGLRLCGATSGLTPEGVDLGSGSLEALTAPAPLLVVGGPVSAYEAGEAWHHLDLVLGVPTSLVEQDRLESLDLDRYTHIIMVTGASSGLDEETIDRVRTWIRQGGVLIATRGSSTWAAESFLDESPEEPGSEEQDSPPAPLAYGDYEDERAVHVLAGSIFEVQVDTTHPLAFGYVRERLPVFRNSTRVLPAGEDPFGSPLRYTAAPLLSGYASKENVDRIAGTVAARAGRVGRGSVVCLVDNPLFRGVWYGTERLFDNALYFGSTLKRTGPVGPPGENAEEAEHGHGHGHGHGH